jgi:hypothetical protein
MFFCESKTLKELSDSLRKELSAIQKISSEQINAIRDAGKAAKEAQEDIKRAISTLQTPESDRTHARTYRKNNFIVQVLLAVGTWLAFIAAAIYAGIAAHQANIMNQTYGQIQKQTTLMRQQMVGTQAAALETVFQFTQSGQFIVNVVNDGLVSATGIHIHGQAERLRLTDGSRIGGSFPFDETFPIIPPKGVQRPSWFLPWHPRELPDKQEWPAGWPGRESFTFEGEITYQNGFGDKIRNTFCQKFLPRYTLLFKSGGLSVGGGGTLEPCRNFDQRVRSILEAEKQAERGADRPDPPI